MKAKLPINAAPSQKNVAHLFKDYKKKITSTVQLGNLHHPWKFIFPYNNAKGKTLEL